MKALFRRVGIGLVLLLAIVAPARSQQGSYDWSEARELHPGVKHARAELTFDNAQGLECPYYGGFAPEKPRKLRLSVLRIDTKSPSLALTTTARADGWGEPMPDYRGEALSRHRIRTERQTTADFVRQSRATPRKVFVAVNSAPWTPFKSGVNHPYADSLGLAISAGTLVSPPNGRPSLVVYKDGRLDMMVVDSQADVSDIDLAVSGFTRCLVDGEPSAADKTLHPRTGYGLCAEKRILYLLVIDGRQDASQAAWLFGQRTQ